MDEDTLANFNNIGSEIVKVRLKGLINAINSNQGLYDSEVLGDDIKKLHFDIQLRSNRKKRWKRAKPPTGLEHSNSGKALVEPYFLERVKDK